MGPSAIRYARIEGCLEDLGHKVTDLGNAVVPIPETVAAGQEVKHLAAVKSVCEEVSERAATIVSEGLFRSSSAGITPSPSGPSPGLRAPRPESGRVLSGSTPTRTSTRLRPRLRATSTACRWRPSQVSATPTSSGSAVRGERQDRGRRHHRPALRGCGGEEAAARGRREGLHHEGHRRLRRGARRAKRHQGPHGRRQVHLSLDLDVLDPESPRASAHPCAEGSPTGRRTS